MQVSLTAPEQRVLGCLLEKRLTTPDQYPLSLNSLRLACNQSTNRNPVTDYDEATVREAAQRLCRHGLARLASGHTSRAIKYRHLAEEALGLGQRAARGARGAPAARSANPRRAQAAKRAHDASRVARGCRRRCWRRSRSQLRAAPSTAGPGRRRTASSICSAKTRRVRARRTRPTASSRDRFREGPALGDIPTTPAVGHPLAPRLRRRRAHRARRGARGAGSRPARADRRIPRGVNRG